MNPKLRTWLVNLYPLTWKQHYGKEFDDLLAQCVNSPLDVLDVILGALDAHLHLMDDQNMNWRKMNMINKLRTSILVVFCAFIGFVIAGLTFNGNLDDSLFIPLMQQNAPLHLAYICIEIGSVIAFFAVITGGLPIAVTVIQRAFTSQRKDLRLLLVPVISFLVLAAYLGIVLAIGEGKLQISGVLSKVIPGQPFPAGNRNLMLGLMMVFVLGAIASCLSVWKVVTHIDFPANSFKLMGHTANISLYHFAFIPAMITTAAMLFMLAASLVWSVLAWSALPQVFYGNDGMWGFNAALPLITAIILMFLMSASALHAILRGLKAYCQSS